MRSIEYLNAGHCKELAQKIRQADRDEVRASHGITDMEECLLNCMKYSSEAWAWVVDGRPIAAFGIAPGSFLTREGIPWMLATDALYAHKYAFMKYAMIILHYWMTEWNVLTNWVDARNTRSIRWLKKLGFVFHEALPYGAEGMPFHRFEMRKGVSHV